MKPVKYMMHKTNKKGLILSTAQKMFHIRESKNEFHIPVPGFVI